MSSNVGFHFLLLAAGEILKTKEYVTAQDIQNFIQEDPNFGVRVPLDECRLALNLLYDTSLLPKRDYLPTGELKFSK